MGHLNQSVWDFTTVYVVWDTLVLGYVFFQVYSYLYVVVLLFLIGEYSASQAKSELVKIQNLYFSYWA